MIFSHWPIFFSLWISFVTKKQPDYLKENTNTNRRSWKGKTKILTAWSPPEYQLCLLGDAPLPYSRLPLTWSNWNEGATWWKDENFRWECERGAYSTHWYKAYSGKQWNFQKWECFVCNKNEQVWTPACPPWARRYFLLDLLRLRKINVINDGSWKCGICLHP